MNWSKIQLVASASVAPGQVTVPMFSPATLEAVVVLVLHVPEHVVAGALDGVREVVALDHVLAAPAGDRPQRRARA